MDEIKKVGMGRRIHSNILMDLKQIIKCFQSRGPPKEVFPTSQPPGRRQPNVTFLLCRVNVYLATQLLGMTRRWRCCVAVVCRAYAYERRVTQSTSTINLRGRPCVCALCRVCRAV